MLAIHDGVLGISLGLRRLRVGASSFVKISLSSAPNYRMHTWNPTCDGVSMGSSMCDQYLHFRSSFLIGPVTCTFRQMLCFLQGGVGPLHLANAEQAGVPQTA